MRRSLLLRLLALSLAVALGAVGATAVLATYSTGAQLKGELDASASLLEADQSIFAELMAYAGNHTDWGDVDQVVRQAAERTGRRVAVTAPDGTVIADSAHGAELPSVPSATIDVASGNYLAKYPGAVSVVKQTAGGEMAMTTAGGDVGSPYWRITPAEIAEREALAAEAVQCLRGHGKAASVVKTPEGVPMLAIEVPKTAGTAGTADTVVRGKDQLYEDPCVPDELTAPSAMVWRVSEQQRELAVACLDKAGLDYQLTFAGGGLPSVAPTATSKADARFLECQRTAREDALKPYVASPAKLYLGTAGRFNVFSSEGLLRTLATALAVLLLAALVTVFAGRRLVRPILALTGAAQRMAAGDRAARVPVSGNDEVSRLGHAFNAMASSIERNEQQRRVMVSDVAHELRTPLSNIRGYLEAGEDGVVPLDRTLIRSLLEETALLERLVSDLQELALADAGMLRLHPEQCDVTELAQQAVAAHRTQAEAAGVSLGLSASGSAIAEVDPARIRQALGNLVANAVKFTPAGGSVSVSVRGGGEGVELAVSDTGPGISPEHLPHLFDRFYRADPSRSRTTGGSGLGLAITKHLVEAHDGWVGVSSTPGRGSVFTIRLPARS
jgi:two-component system, OmpR family, sensor histidine kinase BaeS